MQLSVFFSNNLVIFVPQENKACIFDVRYGNFKNGIDLNFQFTALKRISLAVLRNFAFLVSGGFVFIIRLDRVVQHVSAEANLHPSPAKRSKLSCDEAPVTGGESVIMTSIAAPALDDGKQLVSSTVYGQHLYVAETPISDGGVLTLHATDVNALLAMKDDDTPHWVKHSIALDQSVKDHVNDMSRASVNLFSAKA